MMVPHLVVNLTPLIQYSAHAYSDTQPQATVTALNLVIASCLLLLLWFKAGAPRAEHYQLVRTLSADAVVTVL